MHAGEEIKVAQPRQNKKKKLKGRIYQKLKKAKDDEGEVGDVMDDIAEAKVIQIAQEEKQSINHTRFLILLQVTCVLILVCVSSYYYLCVLLFSQVIQIAQDQNLEIRRLENRWVNAQGEEVEVCVCTRVLYIYKGFF